MMEVTQRARSSRRASLIAKKAWESLQKSSSKSPAPECPEAPAYSVSAKRLKLSETQPQHRCRSRSRTPTLTARGQENHLVSISSSRPGSRSSRSRSGVMTEGYRPRSRSNECKDPTLFSLPKPNGTEFKENIASVSERSMDLGDSSDSEDGSEPSYMQIREENLKANQAFLETIGMHKAKEDFELSVSKKKTTSQRGLKPKKAVEEPLPRRQSLRIRRIDPSGVPLPEPEPIIEPVIVKRLPESVTMKELLYSKSQFDASDNLKPFFSTMSSLKCQDNILPAELDTPENREFVRNIENMKITENQVAKVVLGRVYSVAWHPSSKLIALAGDVNGLVGCWNVLAKDTDEDMVRAFQPHIKPVTHLYVPPKDGHKLYTSSYDATLRCGDFEKGVFDLVFSVPAENDLFRNFDFIGDSSSMLVSHYSGCVSLVDCRTSSKSAEKVFEVSFSSLRKVSVHPVSTQYFITSGRDGRIKLWDLRFMHPRAPKALQIMKNHSKAIASAYFSPLTGKQILSSSSDDTIQIRTASEGTNSDYEVTKVIRHNNHTGRWLTPFQPTWHPTVDGVFVSGSMARPRQIEVFSSTGDLMSNLQGDYLASVCSLNAFHPARPNVLVGANSSGRLHVFM